MKQPKSKPSASARVSDWFQTVVEGDAYWDSSHKMYAQIWEGSWIVYSSSGIKTEANEYGSCWVFWHCWNSLNAQEISVSCDAFLRIYDPYIYAYTYMTVSTPETKEYNNNRAINRFEWTTLQIGYNTGGTPIINLGSLKIDLKGFTATDYAGNSFELVSVQSRHKAKWDNRVLEKNLVWQ